MAILILTNCIPKCDESDFRQEFLSQIWYAQCHYGGFFKINSGYRSLEWEKSRGRGGTSSHTKHCAVDIGFTDHADRLKIVSALLIAGFKRIGIAKTFIHVDSDLDKPSSLWLYNPNNNNQTF